MGCWPLKEYERDLLKSHEKTGLSLSLPCQMRRL